MFVFWQLVGIHWEDIAFFGKKRDQKIPENLIAIERLPKYILLSFKLKQPKKKKKLPKNLPF